MTSLAHAPLRVHSNPTIRIVALPERISEPTWYDGDSEPFHPSPDELAYDLAYSLALAGELADAPAPATPEILAAHDRGTKAGTLARERAEAREMGRVLYHAMGHLNPPPGFRGDQIAAFRLGQQDAQAEPQDELAWDDEDSELESDPITDADLYRPGAVS